MSRVDHNPNPTTQWKPAEPLQKWRGVIASVEGQQIQKAAARALVIGAHRERMDDAVGINIAGEPTKSLQGRVTIGTHRSNQDQKTEKYFNVFAKEGEQGLRPAPPTPRL